jgi:hypothetical protein
VARRVHRPSQVRDGRGACVCRAGGGYILGNHGILDRLEYSQVFKKSTTAKRLACVAELSKVQSHRREGTPAPQPIVRSSK